MKRVFLNLTLKALHSKYREDKAMKSKVTLLTASMVLFWDGGNTWKIRFAPTVVGNWSFTTVSSDPTDTVLHGQTGTVLSQPYSGSLSIYKHGFLNRIRPIAS